VAGEVNAGGGDDGGGVAEGRLGLVGSVVAGSGVGRPQHRAVVM